LKDSEFREFFETNYDHVKNTVKLQDVLELSEGSNQEVYLHCPKHPNENSYKMRIEYWCNPTKHKPVCCSTVWNLRKIKHFIHSLLGDQCLIDHIDTATFYIIMQRVGIFETQSKWLPFLRILPKLERNEIIGFLSNSTDNIGDQLLELCEQKKNIVNLDDMLVKLRRDRHQQIDDRHHQQIQTDDDQQGEYTTGHSSLESLIRSIDLQLGVLEKQEQIDPIGDNDIFNVIYAKYRDNLWKRVFDNEEECINELVHLPSDNEEDSPAIDFIQNYFLKEYNRVKSLQRETNNVFPWTPKLMQCLIVARLERCFEIPFPQMTNSSSSTEVMTRWSYGLGNWSDTGTGKSLSALMCVFYLKCQITVIFCLNSITKQWADECEKFFPGVFRVKIIDPLKKFVSENDDTDLIDSGRPTIYILSYSKFMEKNADKNMKKLVEKLGQIDLIVLDEIHAVKIRYQANSQLSHDDDEDVEDNENRKKEKKEFTKRRRIIQTFVNSVRVKHPEVKTLGLTATPVVNNLMEAESQLSLLSGSSYCERNKQSQKKFETNSPTIDSIMMIHRQLCLYGIRSLLDSEKGPDGKTSIQIRLHPNIHRPCDDYIVRCAVDATEQYIELLNRRVDTVEQLVGGMKVNTLKLSALVKECVAAVSEGYKVIVSNRCKHGQGVLHFLKQYIEKGCSTRLLRVSLQSSCSEERESVDEDVLITDGNIACSSSRYKMIQTNFIRKWTRLEVGLVRTKAKLPEIISICKEKKKNRQKVILFTNNIGGNILETIQSGLSESIPDLRMGTYIGRDSDEKREETKRRFLLADDDLHAIDLVIATEPITTGVDKLQEVCCSLIINLLPMTYKELRQLFGRLVRFGQQSLFVDIYIPLTKVKRTKSGEDDANEEYGSEDYLDIQRLLRKETLCDAAIDGTFPADIKTRLDEEKKDSLLLKWLGVMTDEGGEGPRESNQLKRILPVDADELMEEDVEPMKKKKMKNDDNNVKEDDVKEDDDTDKDNEEDTDNDKNLGVSLKKNRDEFTEKEKQIVRERQNYTCNNRPGSPYEMTGYACSKWINGGDGKFDESGCDSEIDHIIPIKNGGKTILSNAQALCRNCHGYKTFTDRTFDS